MFGLRNFLQNMTKRLNREFYAKNKEFWGYGKYVWFALPNGSSTNNDLVLLLDEPDQHLHVKAQNDILKLINKLASKKEENAVLI